jgi:hypothetical protein
MGAGSTAKTGFNELRQKAVIVAIVRMVGMAYLDLTVRIKFQRKNRVKDIQHQGDGPGSEVPAGPCYASLLRQMLFSLRRHKLMCQDRLSP